MLVNVWDTHWDIYKFYLASFAFPSALQAADVVHHFLKNALFCFVLSDLCCLETLKKETWFDQVYTSAFLLNALHLFLKFH